MKDNQWLVFHKLPSCLLQADTVNAYCRIASRANHAATCSCNTATTWRNVHLLLGEGVALNSQVQDIMNLRRCAMKPWMYFVLGGFVGVIGYSILPLYFVYNTLGFFFSSLDDLYPFYLFVWFLCGVVSFGINWINQYGADPSESVSLTIWPLVFSFGFGFCLGFCFQALLH